MAAKMGEITKWALDLYAHSTRQRVAKKAAWRDRLFPNSDAHKPRLLVKSALRA